GQQRGRIHAVSPLGVERQLLASDTPLGRLQLEFVHRAHQAMAIALGRAQLLLDAAQPVQERLVGFRRLARCRLRAVAVHRHVARCRIRALPLLLQPHPPLAELLLPGLPLLEALGEIGLHLVGAHELPPEGLDALTDRADLDPARGELGHQRGLLGLSVLERAAATSASVWATVVCVIPTVSVSSLICSSSSRSWRLRASSECWASPPPAPPRSRPVGASTSPFGVTYVALTPFRRQRVSA